MGNNISCHTGNRHCSRRVVSIKQHKLSTAAIVVWKCPLPLETENAISITGQEIGENFLCEIYITVQTVNSGRKPGTQQGRTQDGGHWGRARMLQEIMQFQQTGLKWENLGATFGVRGPFIHGRTSNWRSTRKFFTWYLFGKISACRENNFHVVWCPSSGDLWRKTGLQMMKDKKLSTILEQIRTNGHSRFLSGLGP